MHITGIKQMGTKWRLPAFQLKMIALVCMTLDHLAAFGFEITLFSQYSTCLRTIGRIAAPLFLFLLVQSVRHTRSKPRFVLRLYLAGMCVGLFDTAANFFLGEIFGYRTPGNIIFTFFFAALYIVLLEQVISTVRGRDIRTGAIAICGFAASFIPVLLFERINQMIPDGAPSHRFF